MTTPTSLHDRLWNKAKQGVQFSVITSTDAQGRAKTVVTPGSEGKQYEVIIRRFIEKGSPVITTECRCKTGIGFVNCKGNSNGHATPCYHGLTALLKSVDGKNIKLSFCASRERAENLSRMGGTIITIRSQQNGAELWAVAK